MIICDIFCHDIMVQVNIKGGETVVDKTYIFDV